MRCALYICTIPFFTQLWSCKIVISTSAFLSNLSLSIPHMKQKFFLSSMMESWPNIRATKGEQVRFPVTTTPHQHIIFLTNKTYPLLSELRECVNEYSNHNVEANGGDDDEEGQVEQYPPPVKWKRNIVLLRSFQRNGLHMWRNECHRSLSFFTGKTASIVK